MSRQFWIIIKDLLPLSSVTRHHLTRTLQPSLDVQLSASWIRNELQNLYRQKRVEVQNAVNNTSNLALSAELWSSSEKVFYLTVSCHLISENWKLKSYVLDTAHLLTKHTAENAVEHLLRISNEWNVTEKSQIVVTNIDGIKKTQTMDADGPICLVLLILWIKFSEKPYKKPTANLYSRNVSKLLRFSTKATKPHTICSSTVLLSISCKVNWLNPVVWSGLLLSICWRTS